jgi:hypothetical protein
MRVTRLVQLAVVATVGFTDVAAAQTYTEDFNATFPAWEGGWFGQNSDAYNFYCGRPCGNRGNNPTGLWIGGTAGVAQTSQVLVTFNSSFGATLTSLSMDVGAFIATNFNVWDTNGLLIFTQAMSTGGISAPVNNYNNTVAVTSTTGIGAFGFDAVNAAGNTAIDNITVNAATSVPEPATVALVATGLLAVAGVARRRRA